MLISNLSIGRSWRHGSRWECKEKSWSFGRIKEKGGKFRPKILSITLKDKISKKLLDWLGEKWDDAGKT